MKTAFAGLPVVVAVLTLSSVMFAQDGDDESTTVPATETAAPPAVVARPVIQRSNLINNSPFRVLPPRRGPAATATQVLEIRGFMGAGPNLEVSLTNPATLECRWVRVGDRDARWFVESADPVTRTASVIMDGVTIPVSMVKPAELPPPAPPPAPTLSGAGGGGITPQPMPGIRPVPTGPQPSPVQVNPAQSPRNAPDGASSGSGAGFRRPSGGAGGFSGGAEGGGRAGGRGGAGRTRDIPR